MTNKYYTCALRGGKCNCPTACKINMDAEFTSVAAIQPAGDAVQLFQVPPPLNEFEMDNVNYARGWNYCCIKTLESPTAAPVASAPAQPGYVRDVIDALDIPHAPYSWGYLVDQIKDAVEACERLSTTPAQPMSLEAERVAFEAAARQAKYQGPRHQYSLTRFGKDVFATPPRLYLSVTTENAWNLWQARAALATQQGDKHE